MSQQLRARGLLGIGNASVIGLPRSLNLDRELSRAIEIRLATAFAHWSGWDLLRHSIEGASGSVKLLTGLAFCQTEPKVLQDWWKLAQAGRVHARLFADKAITFHPKVLIVKTPSREFAVIGSGNLSAGGLLHNVECSYFVTASRDLKEVKGWFDFLFGDDSRTKDLNDSDIRRYRPLHEKAKAANRSVQGLQVEAEADIGDRHRASLRKWKQAVSQARRFFSSQRFIRTYQDERANIGNEIKAALDYPHFDFDRAGFEQFYKVLALGHLIEVSKPRVWRQRAKLRRMLRLLVNDSIPISQRLSSTLDTGGRLKVDGVGLNFISKVLAVHAPLEFTVHNDPIAKALKHFEYKMPHGYSKSQKYLEFCRLMRQFLSESGARNTLDLDAFFYDYWERLIKPAESKAK